MNAEDIALEQMSTEELLALRQRIDQHLETVRAQLTEQAQRLGLVVATDAKRKRKTRAQREERE